MGNGDNRVGSTAPLGGFVAEERSRLLSGANDERRSQMAAAERRRDVFSAFNAVLAGTRESSHVTGLHYLPETGTLVAYMDSPAWTQEMVMMREIVRARMAAHGGRVDAVQFKTNRLPDHGRPSPAQAAKRTGAGRIPTAPPQRRPAPPHPLSAAEEREVDEAVAPIEDPELRNALRNAIKASFEWKKGSNAT